MAALALFLAVPAARAGEPEMLPLPHRGAVVSCAFSPDGKQVVTASDKVVRLWDLASGRESKQLTLADRVAHAVLSSDGRAVVTASAEKGGRFQMTDPATGKTLWRVGMLVGPFTSLAASPGGRRLAVGTPDCQFCVVDAVDAPSGKVLFGGGGHQGPVTSVALSPDGRRLAVGSSDNSVQVWELPAGRKLLRIQGHKKGVDCVAFAPDGQTLASGGHDKVVRVWDTATGKEVRHLEAKDVVRCVAFAPDGKTLAAAGDDKLVRLFDTATGKESRIFGGLQGKINCLAFSPDGTRLVTAGADCSAVVWDLTRDEKPLPKDLKLTGKELNALWADLGGDDARKAYAALRTLRAAPAGSLRFVRERLKPKPLTDEEKKIAALIADLDSDDFDAREKATKDLEGLGRAAEKATRQALAGEPSPEARVRLEMVLAKLGGEGALTPEQDRDLRAVRVVEGIGTPEARKLLEALVRESPGWWVTAEAKAALRRLEGGR
jgi:hypothetical protein